MEEEWRIFLKENAPKLYEEMLSSVMWQAKWRDEKIATLQAENDELNKVISECLDACRYTHTSEVVSGIINAHRSR